MASPTRIRAGHRLLWFAGLYVASVAVVTAVTYGIRFLIMG
jgi:hypothetical protein